VNRDGRAARFTRARSKSEIARSQSKRSRSLRSRLEEHSEAAASPGRGDQVIHALQERIARVEEETRSEAAGAHRELSARENEASKVSKLEEEVEGHRLLIRHMESAATLTVPRSAAMREVEDLARARSSLAILEEQHAEQRAATEMAEKRLAASEENSSAQQQRATERQAEQDSLVQSLRAAATSSNDRVTRLEEESEHSEASIASLRRELEERSAQAGRSHEQYEHAERRVATLEAKTMIFFDLFSLKSILIKNHSAVRALGDIIPFQRTHLDLIMLRQCWER